MHDGATFTHNGNTFRVQLQFDSDHAPPWDAEDGHGPVTGWMPRDRKKPGDRILIKDRSHARMYDFAEACRIALRDGWLCNADVLALRNPNRPKRTKRELAARAAEEDFQRLRAWCEGGWEYVGVVVTLLDDDGDATDESASLWGVESDAGDYLEEVARELADEITAHVRVAMGAEA